MDGNWSVSGLWVLGSRAMKDKRIGFGPQVSDVGCRVLGFKAFPFKKLHQSRGLTRSRWAFGVQRFSKS